MTAETPPIRRANEIDKLNRKIERLADRLSERITRVERAMYVMIGVGLASGGTALFNLLNGSSGG